MIVYPELNRIQAGDATPSEARKAIRALLAEATPERSALLYAALRGWTWKALMARRLDNDLSEWFSVLRSTSAQLGRLDAEHSHYVLSLSHLIDDTLRYAASSARTNILSRSHVGEILELVRRNNGRCERVKIEAEAGLSSSRLSQLLTELTVEGFLSREVDGKRAIFILTDAGRELLDRRHMLQHLRETEFPEEEKLYPPRIATRPVPLPVDIDYKPGVAVVEDCELELVLPTSHVVHEVKASPVWARRTAEQPVHGRASYTPAVAYVPDKPTTAYAAAKEALDA